MNDKEIRAKYDLTKFEEVNKFEFKSYEMRDTELFYTIYGDAYDTDDKKLIDMIAYLDNVDYEYYDVAIRDYGSGYLGNVALVQLQDDEGAELWHADGILYMTSNDSGVEIDLYFDHKPENYEVIHEFCQAEGITDDFTIMREGLLEEAKEDLARERGCDESYEIPKDILSEAIDNNIGTSELYEKITEYLEKNYPENLFTVSMMPASIQPNLVVAYDLDLGSFEYDEYIERLGSDIPDLINDMITEQQEKNISKQVDIDR